ncbi:MAG TPA: phosphoribosylglycinamide formyltransferase [Rhodospirillaceae bacterium]|nr:phosphoribosylglycinamide formyltransferase [Magnetovibrio sp.]HBT43466.1 phosphoribosylglycinamide formyltransferase [Rhodospirillaceae bacterium]HCS69255.1 phosphoribosylglycinamide formyltransferase [Rhodospirillaceae bacterium]|tara:strand:- start:664 stop:1317 length:654 start_codon:yes stop_codon:yes gene_type:complete
MSRLKLAVMISGRGSNLQALIDATADPAFPAEIILVLSNRPGAMGLERAAKAGIPTRVIDHKEFADRAAFDREMTAAMEDAGTDLVCLAGFMRLLSDAFVDHWRDRMINIHPSLLPAFKGLEVQERVLARGARFAGCTVHYVRKEMDTGPIIVQAVVPVHPDDTPDSLAARVLEREHDIYPLAVRLIAEGRVSIDENDRAVITGAVAQESALLNPKG